MLKLATGARKLKITAVLDAAPFMKFGVPPDNAPPRTNLVVTVSDRMLHADVATKSVRKAVKTLLEHREQNITLMIQGSLVADNRVEEAGITAQVKVQPQRRPRGSRNMAQAESTKNRVRSPTVLPPRAMVQSGCLR